MASKARMMLTCHRGYAALGPPFPTSIITKAETSGIGGQEDGAGENGMIPSQMSANVLFVLTGA